MAEISTHAHVGADGILRLTIDTELQDIDVDIKLIYQPTKSSTGGMTAMNSLSLAERRQILKQPIAERRRLLALQAEAMQAHYEQNTEWQGLMSGDIVEY